MSELTLTKCPDCAVKPGQLHRSWCDTAHCPDTGRQRANCDHKGRCDSLWTGVFVGAAECQEWDWWCYENPDLGLVPCPRDTPGAEPDYNRLITHARWDPDNQRYQRKITI